MSKKLKGKKVERVPEHARAYEIKEDNFFEIAELINAPTVTTTFNTDGLKPPFVEFRSPRGWVVHAPVGGYLVATKTSDGSYSYSGYTKEHLEEYYRDGWS